MLNLYKAIFLLLILNSCKKVDISSELQEGSWLFQKIETFDNEIILESNGEPKILLFFKNNGNVEGRLIGDYQIDKDELYIKLRIDTINNHFFGDFELANFPGIYKEFEAITKHSIKGKFTHYEDGWNSKFSIQYEENRIMWFKRY